MEALEEYLRAAAKSQLGLRLKCVQPEYFVQRLTRIRKENPDIPYVVISRRAEFPDEVWLIPKEVYDAQKIS